MQLLFFLLEIIGTIAFSASGTMLGIQKKMDLFGVCVLGVVTAVGGGMIRDSILGKVPSALMEPAYTGVAGATALILFFIIYAKRNIFHNEKENVIYDRLIAMMDAIGLGVFTVVGVDVGVNAGYGEKTFLLIFLGVITGVGGGLLRDIMAQQAPYILVRHIYASASIVGAILYVIIWRNFGELIGLILAPIIVFLIRLLASHYKWNLPRIQ